MAKLTASLSLDLDNLWSYLKTHGDPEWKDYPTYLPQFIPLVLDWLRQHRQSITFFVVGRDAANPDNHACIARIAEAGHEIGNHSYDHEPWMQSYDEPRVADELQRAHNEIVKVASYIPRGFRGPGFCYSSATLQTLVKMGYEFDASILPSMLGPLARLYYFSTSSMSKEEKETRGELFGKLSDGLLPLKPFRWSLPAGAIVEIPVTTIPVFRVPFHLSYILWLSRFNPALAMTYLRFGLAMCRLRGVEPSYLLHPLDFIGCDLAPQLSFFPGMDLVTERKMAFASRFIALLQSQFDVIPMGEHAQRLRDCARLPSVARN